MKIKEQYKKEVVPKMKEDFGYKNTMAVPRMEKATLNIGLGPGIKEQGYKEAAEQTLMKITGQKPVFTKARKSIASFKIREGMEIGAKVTLRGDRMYDFVEKLVNIALPRVRDFRGINDSTVDKNGNISIGLTESQAFPEVKPEEIDIILPLEITITTTAKTREEGLALFKNLGFPFKNNK